MQRHELFRRLAGTLSGEAAVLHELAEAMKAERAAFVALRSSDLEDGLARLATAAQRACSLSAEREQILSSLATSIGVPAPLTLKVLAPHVPADLRPLLDGAAESARAAAREVRLESRVGGRLLQESRRWHRSLLGDRGQQDAAPTMYDARAVARQVDARRGSLIRGTI